MASLLFSIISKLESGFSFCIQVVDRSIEENWIPRSGWLCLFLLIRSMGLKPEITNQFTASTSSALCLRLIRYKSAFLQLSVPACKTGNSEPDCQLWTGTAPLMPSVRRGHIWPKLSIRHPWWGKQSDLHCDLAHCIHVCVERRRRGRMLLWYRYYTALLKLNQQCRGNLSYAQHVACVYRAHTHIEIVLYITD